jgi:hypothetical protein
MGEVLYSTKWVKYSALLRAATQEDTTTTHNNQLAPLLSMGPNKACGVGCPLAALQSLVWGTKMQPIKKEREGRGLGLWWLPFSYFTQQPTKRQCRWWGGDSRRDATGVKCVGAMVARCLGHQDEQQKIIEIKYLVALGGRQMANWHNNQPKTHGRNQGGTGEEV